MSNYSSNDRHILITGATNGIGLAAAEAFVALGANLAIIGRSKSRTRVAAARINAAAKGGATVATFVSDLSSQACVRRLAAEVLARYPRLDVLVNNAGAVYRERQLTTDGIELTWAVNHLAPFLLTTLLLDRLKESAPARIITTASEAHQGAHIPFSDLNAERSYRSFGRYGETKLANILFTSELARRLKGTGVTANCFHPGLVATGFNRNNGLLMALGMTILGPVSRSPQKGADTLVWLATSPDVANVSGGYFFDQQQRSPSPKAQDTETARWLWEISERQCGVSGRSAEVGS
jgi:NAD(P)-dependent dehydrogenase (short-subunit alcohol dehydrogenase family)